MIDIRLATGLKWGIGLLGAVVISPVILLAVKGIVGLAAALLCSAIFINAAPIVADKLANWKLKAIKDEASKNPIETMQNTYIGKQKELADAEKDEARVLELAELVA